MRSSRGGVGRDFVGKAAPTLRHTLWPSSGECTGRSDRPTDTLRLSVPGVQRRCGPVSWGWPSVASSESESSKLAWNGTSAGPGQARRSPAQRRQAWRVSVLRLKSNSKVTVSDLSHYRSIKRRLSRIGTSTLALHRDGPGRLPSVSHPPGYPCERPHRLVGSSTHRPSCSQLVATRSDCPSRS
jgi:hypothetical protein